ncbi:MAG: SpoIIE family protein phosphatase [Chloroflexi bacterium]|nr:SpoIIE family protein phosphatase [Chloroflexota bacterium]
MGGEQGKPVIEYGVATLPLPGQVETGDRYLVKESPRGALIAVVDGLGHGKEAGEAAEMATSVLEGESSIDLVSAVARCHEQLKRSRGAVMTIALLDASAGTLSWVSVGNVEGVLVRAEATEGKPKREAVFPHAGVVGHHLPALAPSQTRICPGDTVILCTDGVRPDFLDIETRGKPPQRIADDILRAHAGNTDDALVLVVRYLGGCHAA